MSILNEINKLNFDVSRNSSIEKYDSCLRMNNFRKVYEKDFTIEESGLFESVDNLLNYVKKTNYIIKDYKEKENGFIEANYVRREKEAIYWHDGNSFLIHFDTYQGSINSASMSGNARNKNNKNLMNGELSISGGYISGTDIIGFSIHINESPARIIKQMIKCTEPVLFLRDFNETLHSSYDQRGAEYKDIKFKENSVNKLKELPINILEKLFSENIRYCEEHSELKKIGINIKQSREEIEKYLINLK